MGGKGVFSKAAKVNQTRYGSEHEILTFWEQNLIIFQDEARTFVVRHPFIMRGNMTVAPLFACVCVNCSRTKPYLPDVSNFPKSEGGGVAGGSLQTDLRYHVLRIHWRQR